MNKRPSSMQALQLRGLNQLVQVKVPVPTPGEDEVLIQTKAATICTSDLHDLKSNPFCIKYPIIMGHEAAGVIVQGGAGVKNLSPGMRVASHPVIPCGACEECRRGFDHICTNMSHLGIDKDGCFAEYYVQRADRVRAIPNDVSFDKGALLEPVAVCLQAISRSGDIKGKTVLIAGDGPFGNIIARLANRAGAARVLVSGREPFRLSKIPGVEVLEYVPLKSVDVAILAVSAAEAMATCLNALRPRGRLVIFSTLMAPVKVDLFAVHVSELEIVGACNDENKIDESLLCLADPALALDELITHHIPFANWEEAFTLARDQHDQTLKVALTF
ncbi:MAG: zinc-dependent alcohol dehydrogenase [Sphingobacteriaceae bacterium]